MFGMAGAARISRFEKFRVFCARRVVLVPVVARALNSAHHESSHASGAFDTAENDSK